MLQSGAGLVKCEMLNPFKFSFRESLKHFRGWSVHLPDTSSPYIADGLHVLFPHPGHLPCPMKLGLEEHCFNAFCLGFIQDLKVGDLVLPVDGKDGTKGMHTEWLQQLGQYSDNCLKYSLTPVCLCVCVFSVLWGASPESACDVAEDDDARQSGAHDCW